MCCYERGFLGLESVEVLEFGPHFNTHFMPGDGTRR